MKTMQSKIERINEYLNSELVNDNFKELLYQLTQLNIGTTKNDLLKLSGYTEDQTRKIDSAIPLDYANRIKEMYPAFNGLNHCYDYNENSFGEMLNVIELFGQYVLNTCLDNIS